MVGTQALTGTFNGTVKDEQGAVLPSARVRVSSPALIGGPATELDARLITARVSTRAESEASVTRELASIPR